jgi:cobalt-zinc-cadmium efflux system protein
VAASVNAGWLLILSLLVGGGAVDRLINGTPHVRGAPVLIISGIAAIVMGASAILLAKDDTDDSDRHDTLNMQAVLLDTTADAAAAAHVAATGAIIILTHGFYWLDPTVALVIAAIVSYHAARLLIRVGLTNGQ